MAKPNQRLPQKTVDVICSGCKTKLFKYHKGGKGALIKCFKQRIAEDYTEQPCTCPSCGSVFARDAMVRGTPAYKIIGNKAVAR